MMDYVKKSYGVLLAAETSFNNDLDCAIGIAPTILFGKMAVDINSKIERKSEKEKHYRQR